MAIIDLNYQDTINKADELGNLAAEIKGICSSNLGNINSSCSSIWKGDAGAAYQKKLRQIQSKIEKRAKSLETIANSMGGIARRLRQVEDYAKSYFNN